MTTYEEATHANKLLYTDIQPYEIIEKRTARKILIREMDAELDAEWKMDIIPGGFVGHVANNDTQKYSYTSNEEYPIKAIRLDKRGNWKDKYGNNYSLSIKPYKFHDYNF